MKTSLHALLCIVVRTSGLATAASTLLSLPEIFAYTAAAGSNLPPAFPITMAAVTFVIGCLLWVYPRAIASLATTRSSHEPFESPVEAADLQRIAFSVVGVWFALSGVVAMVYGIARYIGVRMTDDGTFDGAGVFFGSSGIWSALATIVAGIALALGSRGLVGLLHTLRTASPAPPPKIEEGS